MSAETVKNKPYLGHHKRLRERFIKSGLDGFHDYEVIELLLTLATPRRDCKQAAKDALEQRIMTALASFWREQVTRIQERIAPAVPDSRKATVGDKVLGRLDDDFWGGEEEASLSACS